MVYITGDMHGDENRLFDKEWWKLKKGDILIVCGDFGFLWDNSKEENEVINYLANRKFTVAFVDGTHDNQKIISSKRVTRFKGGKVHRIKGNLLHLMRGQVFNFEGHSFFTFGGGESTDKDMRLESGHWWREEMPTPEEMAEGAGALDEHNCKVDFIITHEPPSLVKSAVLLRRGSVDRVNKLNGYFEEIDRSCDYKQWFFGSLHEDRTVTPKHTCVFNKILPIKDFVSLAGGETK